MAAQQTYRLFDVALKQRLTLSPSLTRMVFAAPDVANMKTEGPDQRIKLFFPLPGQDAPHVPRGEDWYARYRALPDEARAPMRTYTLRALRPERGEVDIDFVLHGETGPASRWATHARVGDRIGLLAPDAQVAGSREGVEWKPPSSMRRALLVADDSALPAVAGILEDLARWPHPLEVQAFIEVEHEADVLPLAAPDGTQLFWLVRDGAAHGQRLQEAVCARIGPSGVRAAEQALAEIDIDQDILWEQASTDGAGLYAWVAGEAGAVMAIRRHLVKDCGIDRQAISFMGYWRRGKVLD